MACTGFSQTRKQAMLESFLSQLKPPPLLPVPPVPPHKKQVEPLQATDYGAVPPVPPVPPQKTETKTKNKSASLSETETPFTTCRTCQHFKCFNSHGEGAGYCLVGGDYGLWSETRHQCIRHTNLSSTNTRNITKDSSPLPTLSRPKSKIV